MPTGRQRPRHHDADCGTRAFVDIVLAHHRRREPRLARVTPRAPPVTLCRARHVAWPNEADKPHALVESSEPDRGTVVPRPSDVLRYLRRSVGTAGFEPATSCTPSKRANPSCATPRSLARINRTGSAVYPWSSNLIVESSGDLSTQPQTGEPTRAFRGPAVRGDSPRRNPVVVGIDPRPEELPPGFLERFPEDREGVAERLASVWPRGDRRRRSHGRRGQVSVRILRSLRSARRRRDACHRPRSPTKKG